MPWESVYVPDHDCIRCADDDPIQQPCGLPWTASRMFLCPECGNKRCPKATDHRYACTGSNDTGQAGSVY